MTNGPSSTRIPAPSVLEIDRSKYPFSSPLFEPETTDGFRIRKLLDEKIGWSTRSELSYFEVVGGKGDLYERLDVGDHGVAQFVYDTQRSPELRIFFVSADVYYEGPLSLTRVAFVELLEKTGVPPTFIEVYLNKSGASIGSPIYSDGDQEKVIAYHILVKMFNTDYENAAVYFRHDFSTRRTTCLIFGSHSSSLQNRFQQLFPGGPSTGTSRPPHYLRDPFVVLSTIVAEYVTHMKLELSDHSANVFEYRKKTGVVAHLFAKPMRDSPSALPSQIQGLHTCSRNLVYFICALDFLIEWVAFLQRQRRIVNDLPTKVMLDGADVNSDCRMKTETIASQKVSASLDLSASLLHNMLSDVRTLSRDTQTVVSIVQSIISQFDSRTNISIAHDLKKDSVAMKAIAGLTMVFLPGTFTATFFSMVFFHVTDDPEPRLTVDKHWWLYVAVAVPLTVLVLAAWLTWLRWKRQGMQRDAELEVLGEEGDEQDTSVEFLVAGRKRRFSSSSVEYNKAHIDF